MGRKYNNPPVVEALCEFQFVSDNPWDLTIPGLIYEKVRDEFPDKQRQIGVNVRLQPTEKGLEHKIETSPPRIQFHKRDKTALIQIAPDVLVINQLKPYPTWSKFKEMVLKNFKIYREIANPKGLKRIGLRYINVIDLDNLQNDLEKYFSLHLSIPKGLPGTVDSILSRIKFSYEDNKENLMLTFASIIPRKPNMTSILLDLDYALVIPEYVKLNEISDWLEKAHERIESTFESCITENTRKIFGESKQ